MSKRLQRKDRAKKAAMIGIPVVGIFAGLGKIFSKRRKKRQEKLGNKISQTVTMKSKANRESLI